MSRVGGVGGRDEAGARDLGLRGQTSSLTACDAASKTLPSGRSSKDGGREDDLGEEGNGYLHREGMLRSWARVGRA